MVATVIAISTEAFEGKVFTAMRIQVNILEDHAASIFTSP